MCGDRRVFLLFFAVFLERLRRFRRYSRGGPGFARNPLILVDFAGFSSISAGPGGVQRNQRKSSIFDDFWWVLVSA